MKAACKAFPRFPRRCAPLYKTAWEIKQRAIIDLAADRGAFICQSQSMNLFMENPDFKKALEHALFTLGKRG
jgi:ribonucleoside-diphosphate reductase alpha chain